MEIRDSRNGSWYWVNLAVNACKHISHADKSVYGALASFWGCKEIRPNFDTICDRSNTSARQAKNSIKRLVEVGLISVVSGRGRSHSNVYELLKCPKGCKKCTFIKGAENAPEKVQKVQIKGAENAHELDKEIDNNNIILAEQSSAGVNEVIDLFKTVNPAAYKKWFANKTQRASVKRLIDLYGKDQILRVVNFLPKTNNLQFCPVITTPIQLEDKYSALGACLIKKKEELSSNRIVKI